MRGEYSVYYTFTVMEEDCDGLCWLYLIEEEGLKPDYIVPRSRPRKLFRGQRGRMEIEILLGISSSAPSRAKDQRGAGIPCGANGQLNEDRSRTQTTLGEGISDGIGNGSDISKPMFGAG